MKVEYNISRLEFLMELYKLPIGELLSIINQGRKREITKELLYSNEVDINILKGIDKIFKKGVNFYLEPSDPIRTKESSIFFRKQKFGVELNIESKRVVNEFEDQKTYLSILSKLSNLKTTRKLSSYSIEQNPREVAIEVRKKLYPRFSVDKTKFLKSLISKLSEYGIMVLEFAENHNKKEKANIEGFFLLPNFIVLKKAPNALIRRELFTLAHELGHFLINEEEIEDSVLVNSNHKKISAIERWCNDFAFYFLAGNYADSLAKISKIESKNDYCTELIESISGATHLSIIAIYTKLLYENKISKKDYFVIKTDIDANFEKAKEQDKKKRDLDESLGIVNYFRVAKPIVSPLYKSTIQSAYFEGVINEFEACKKLKIKPEKFESLLA